MIGERDRPLTLDEHIAALVGKVVVDAVERASHSKEVMNPEEARHFLGLTKDEFKKRRHKIRCRRESERKVYYLRSDLLGYVESLPAEPQAQSDYPPDYPQHRNAPGNTLIARNTR